MRKHKAIHLGLSSLYLCPSSTAIKCLALDFVLLVCKIEIIKELSSVKKKFIKVNKFSDINFSTS